MNTGQITKEALTETKAVLAEDLFVRKLYELVKLHGGVIELPRILWLGIWNINSIVIEAIDYELPEEYSMEEWNNYCDKIRTKIGSKSGNHSEWVKDDNYKTIGVLSLLNADTKEVRIKHFHEWEALYRYVSKIFR